MKLSQNYRIIDTALLYIYKASNLGMNRKPLRKECAFEICYILNGFKSSGKCLSFQICMPKVTVKVKHLCMNRKASSQEMYMLDMKALPQMVQKLQ